MRSPQETAVIPPPLLNGHDLMALLDLPPGRRIGDLLEQLREAQALGEVNDRDEAIAFVRGSSPVALIFVTTKAII